MCLSGCISSLMLGRCAIYLFSLTLNHSLLQVSTSQEVCRGKPALLNLSVSTLYFWQCKQFTGHWSDWSGIGTGCQWRWWSHSPWRCSRKGWISQWGMWLVVRRDGLMVGMDDLSSLSNLNGCTGKNHPVMVMHPWGLGFFAAFPCSLLEWMQTSQGRNRSQCRCTHCTSKHNSSGIFLCWCRANTNTSGCNRRCLNEGRSNANNLLPCCKDATARPINDRIKGIWVGAGNTLTNTILP